MAVVCQIRWISAIAVAGLLCATAARAGAFEELLSFVFFEEEFAYKDAQNFVCRHITTEGEGDYCKASFRILVPRTCKIEVIREFRATWGGGKGREFMRANEVYTIGNLDMSRINPEFLPEKKAARLRFEGGLELYRHEGYQYSFDLDEKGQYASCRINGSSEMISEDECVRLGTKAPSASNKMSLLFGRFGYLKAIEAVRTLQSEYCPSEALKL